MSGFVCPHCNEETALFKPTTGGAKYMCECSEVPFLGQIPLDPKLMLSADTGASFIKQHPDAAGAKAFKSVFEKILASVKERRGEEAIKKSGSA
eukprot:GABW01001084.1.p1 GENE.GABW01001084.1~~GABW01001084.1.p1  ORF type:complete len:94 (-),score=41.08 GABW01001084.1:110-391(-)